MQKRDEINRKVDIATSLYEKQDVFYVGDTNNCLSIISKRNSVNKSVKLLSEDMQLTTTWTTLYKSAFTKPIFFLIKLMEYIVRKSKKVDDRIEHRRDKEKILEEIDEALKVDANILDVVQKLNQIIFEKDLKLVEVADRSDIDYSYLNKFLNKKFDNNNKTITKSFLLRLCLALELDLNDTNDLICRAGYFLCGQDKRDIVISICIDNKAGLILTNQILDEKGFKILN